MLVDIGRVSGLGNSKIRYLAFTRRLDEDVLGFEVAMDDAARVEVFEASEDLLAEGLRNFLREGAVIVQAGLNCSSGDVLEKAAGSVA